MDENNSIQLFEDRKIRTAWDEEQEEWYFSVVDVIAVLTDSSNPTDYLKKMRKRDEQLASYLGTNCPQVAMMGATGKKRKVLAATAEQILRIIQSIPSPKAEPFKLWLAQVGRERIEETIDPEQAIDRALETYQKILPADVLLTVLWLLPLPAYSEQFPSCSYYHEGFLFSDLSASYIAE